MKDVLYRLPSNVYCRNIGKNICVYGPKGEVRFELVVKSLQKSNMLVFSDKLTHSEAVQFKQALLGVSLFYIVELYLEGIGFRVDLLDNKLVFKLGYSHSIIVDIPESINVLCSKENIRFSSSCLIELKNFSTRIRSLNFPNCYKGHGIVYKNEILKKKEGKKNN